MTDSDLLRLTKILLAILDCVHVTTIFPISKMAKGEENKGENSVEKLRRGALMVPTRRDALAPPPASAMLTT